MKAIMVMFDSLNRRMLEPYGCDWVKTPNFTRLAAHSVRFDNSYACSLPCMPARRELHTGRHNFLHRAWGPLEPFDDSMPAMLKENGVHSHLISDHFHYWEDGGATYHTKYQTWEGVRGQEGDPWKGDMGEPPTPGTARCVVGPLESDDPTVPALVRQDWVNRSHMPREADMPMATTFRLGLEFIEKNAGEDNWFLQLETFDPHEPFFSPQHYKDLYPHDSAALHYDWPPYRKVAETPEEIQHLRYESAALHTMCDAYLGRVLDAMDAHDLWKDTLLIVNTDHGFMLGEHEWWGKSMQPFYDEIAHTPLFIWDPHTGQRGQVRRSLVGTIDIAPTLLEYFGIARTPHMQGVPLRQTVADDTPVHDALLFGLFGGQVNVADGRYVYMRGGPPSAERPVYEYTLMPCKMSQPMAPQRLAGATLASPFTFTKGCPLLRVPYEEWQKPNDETGSTWLFDMENDPRQQHSLDDPEQEARMVGLLVKKMTENDAPEEQYIRLGLEKPGC